ncbi:hypothetical protein ACE6H2_004712 [Prunus campanulata]
MTELENKTRKNLEIREYWNSAPEGVYVVAVRLLPGEQKEIPATKFHDAIVDACNRGMVIKVTTDGPTRLRALVRKLKMREPDQSRE